MQILILLEISHVDSTKQLRSLLMISSVIRLLSPGQTPLVRGDSREKPCVYVCLSTPANEGTQTHPPTGIQHIAPTLPSFHNAIFVLSQHSQSGLWNCLNMRLRSSCPVLHCVLNLLFLRKKRNILMTAGTNNCYITTSLTSQINIQLYLFYF